MTTVREIITESFREAGILGLGVTLKAEDAQNGFKRLNWMLAQWNKKRWLIYSLENYPILSTGKVSYTVGVGGDLELPERPDKCHSAFFQLVNGGSFSDAFDDDFDIASTQGGIDYPLNIISSKEDYNRIRSKQQIGNAGWLYYEPTFPLGRFLLWPVPLANGCRVVVCFKTQLPALTSLGQTINLPSEYYAALHYNLAIRLGAAYRKQQHPTVVALATDALNVLRTANIQVPTLQMPRELDYVSRSVDWE